MKIKLSTNQILNKIIKQLNIKKNDKIHLSLDLMKVYINLRIEKISLKKFSEFFLKKILKKIGINGVLAVPVFDLNCIKSGFYNKKESKGQSGSFGNYLLKKYYRYRSYNPMNSFLFFGKNNLNYINYVHQNCHGNSSIWQKFLDENFKLVTIGHHYVRSFTIVHFLERKSKVKYRYDKTFKIKYNDLKTNQIKKFIFFARKINICNHSTITFYCDKIFLKKKIVKFVKYKKLINFSVNLKEASKLILTDLKKRKPKLVSCVSNNKKTNNVLDHSNVIDLEKKYQNTM